MEYYTYPNEHGDFIGFAKMRATHKGSDHQNDGDRKSGTGGRKNGEIDRLSYGSNLQLSYTMSFCASAPLTSTARSNKLLLKCCCNVVIVAFVA